MPTDLALGYVREFVRLLEPRGAAVFQAPAQYLTDGPARRVTPCRSRAAWRRSK